MDKAIEDKINNCIACKSTGWPASPAKVQPSYLPNEVWDTLDIDFLQDYFLMENMYLLLWINNLNFRLLLLPSVLQQRTLSKSFTSYLVNMVTLEKSLATMGHRLSQK